MLGSIDLTNQLKKIQTPPINITKNQMKRLLVSLCVVCMVTVTYAQKEKLFNGKNLDGWTIYGTEKWFVEDGLLICESGPPDKLWLFGH